MLFEDPKVETCVSEDDGSSDEVRPLPTDTDVWHIDLHGNLLPKWYDSKDGTHGPNDIR